MAEPRGVEILLVEDNAEDAEMTIRALKKNHLANRIHHVSDGAEAMPVYIGREQDVMRGFVVNELPLTVLIDANGHELARAAGPQKWDDPASVAYLTAISAPRPAGSQHAGTGAPPRKSWRPAPRFAAASTKFPF